MDKGVKLMKKLTKDYNEYDIKQFAPMVEAAFKVIVYRFCDTMTVCMLVKLCVKS